MAVGKKRQSYGSSGTYGNNSYFSSTYNRSSSLNFRSNSVQEDRGGTRPTAGATSIGFVLVSLLLHICRKSLLFDTMLKVAIYCGTLFVGSAIADNLPIPKSYFSRSDNAINRYFIKWSWGWLLTIVGPWVVLTAHTLGCGRRMILIKHIGRLIFATCAWILWMRFFNYIESNYGRCINTKDILLQSKSKCLQAGLFWSGLDISGHTFIIVYSCLILSEEGFALIGWEGIKDLVMQEEHTRSIEGEISTSSLRKLSDNDLEFLKKAHKTLTPYLRALFVIMTIHQIVSDIMLLATILYFHVMIEKLIGGMAAIMTWYLSYHWLFKKPNSGFMSPGEGIFKYNNGQKKDYDNLRSRRNTSNKVGPTFMGMPLRTGSDYSEGPSINRSKDYY